MNPYKEIYDEIIAGKLTPIVETKTETFSLGPRMVRNLSFNDDSVSFLAKFNHGATHEFRSIPYTSIVRLWGSEHEV